MLVVYLGPKLNTSVGLRTTDVALARAALRQPEQAVETTVDELEPALRWATAMTTRTTRSQSQ
jgi:hypothetical protein